MNHSARGSRRETIYLVGTSGHPNFGDEFITAAWLKFLAGVRPQADVWLDCPVPGQAAHFFGGMHPRVRFTDTLWRLVWDTASLERAEADQLIDERVAHFGTPRYDIGLQAARHATTIHVLGGGYINAIWPHHAGLLRAARALREHTGARLAATGLGLVPAPTEPSLLESLKAFDHVGVRDRPSAELAGAELGADDAFLEVARMKVADKRPAEPGDVWVCLQSDMSDQTVFEAAVEGLRTTLTSPAFQGRTVRYVEAIPGVDHAAYERLEDLIPRENFVPFLGLWEQEFPARPGQTWLTSRFHLHLLAAACGAEGVAIEVSRDYYRVKHESLLDAGTGWSVAPAGATVLPDPSLAPSFAARAKQLAQDKWREAQVVYPKSRRR
ncbi:polysaccharide pyruvyl transferase family protein [Nocardioides caldifontis]|uniref:polysaccharide pyruvyl transferase family protein n=1 Tax=Nocardioides caldifontis TaxID=2588938 RepID=UPI0011E05B62|nr:polysaccharide pyruvyl transferase family protein [Nocardioides caldifontis]